MTTFMTYKEECEVLRQCVAELERERDRLSELCDKWHSECDDMREANNHLANVADALKQQRDELLKEVGEPVVISEPNYHHEAMGCGLEDRNITDRYEAMQHGWDCAISRMLEQIPEGDLYTSDQLAAAQEECEFQRNAHKQAEELMLEQSKQLAVAQEEIERLRIALDCTKRDLIRMRCPDFFEGVKDGYENLFDGHLVNMIGLINDYAKQK